MVVLSCLLLTGIPASAAGLIRDAEIERTLNAAARPLLQQAGVPVVSTNILIVNDTSMNAFVAGGNNIFVHAGLVMKLESVEMLQAVLAHEIGHITGGHAMQRAVGATSAGSAAGIGILLSLLTAAASGEASAGGAVMLGTADAVRNSVLSNTRAQEASADQSGVRYMAAAGIDPSPTLDVLNMFRGQELLSTQHLDPYARTHPIWSDRIARLKGYVSAYKPRAVQMQDEDIGYWYERAQAKFRGFIQSPKSTLQRYPESDTSEPALLARAVAYHRQGMTAKALASVDTLIGKRPDDAYYHELKGQILLESGKVSAAVQSYRRAVELAPKESLIQSGLGRALLATDTPANNKEALLTLTKSHSQDQRDGNMLRDLALAYARDGQNGMASVITAERYALAGNFKQATIHAKRAQNVLPQGTIGWLRADDILIAAKALEKGK